MQNALHRNDFLISGILVIDTMEPVREFVFHGERPLPWEVSYAPTAQARTQIAGKKAIQLRHEILKVSIDDVNHEVQDKHNEFIHSLGQHALKVKLHDKGRQEAERNKDGTLRLRPRPIKVEDMEDDGGVKAAEMLLEQEWSTVSWTDEMVEVSCEALFLRFQEDDFHLKEARRNKGVAMMDKLFNNHRPGDAFVRRILDFCLSSTTSRVLRKGRSTCKWNLLYLILIAKKKCAKEMTGFGFAGKALEMMLLEDRLAAILIQFMVRSQKEKQRIMLDDPEMYKELKADRAEETKKLRESRVLSNRLGSRGGAGGMRGDGEGQGGEQEESLETKEQHPSEDDEQQTTRANNAAGKVKSPAASNKVAFAAALEGGRSDNDNSSSSGRRNGSKIGNSNAAAVTAEGQRESDIAKESKSANTEVVADSTATETDTDTGIGTGAITTTTAPTDTNANDTSKTPEPTDYYGRPVSNEVARLLDITKSFGTDKEVSRMKMLVVDGRNSDLRFRWSQMHFSQIFRSAESFDIARMGPVHIHPTHTAIILDIIASMVSDEMDVGSAMANREDVINNNGPIILSMYLSKPSAQFAQNSMKILSYAAKAWQGLFPILNNSIVPHTVRYMRFLRATYKELICPAKPFTISTPLSPYEKYGVSRLDATPENGLGVVMREGSAASPPRYYFPPTLCRH